MIRFSVFVEDEVKFKATATVAAVNTANRGAGGARGRGRGGAAVRGRQSAGGRGGLAVVRAPAPPSRTIEISSSDSEDSDEEVSY